jgi:hypothetical protein
MPGTWCSHPPSSCAEILGGDEVMGWSLPDVISAGERGSE